MPESQLMADIFAFDIQYESTFDRDSLILMDNITDCMISRSCLFILVKKINSYWLGVRNFE